jgi:hypothetical protein
MDAANPREIEDFREGGFLEWPWTRVAIFLAALSVLYVAVDVLRTPESRGQFFAGADEGVSQRLAVRRAYEERLPIWSTDAADPSGPRSSPDSASERGSPTVASPASGRPS